MNTGLYCCHLVLSLGLFFSQAPQEICHEREAETNKRPLMTLSGSDIRFGVLESVEEVILEQLDLLTGSGVKLYNIADALLRFFLLVRSLKNLQ